MAATGSRSSTTTSLRLSTNLSPEETDLWELCYYAGVIIDPQIFRVLVDLLNLNVHPKAVLDVLKSIVPHSKYVGKEDPSHKAGKSNVLSKQSNSQNQTTSGNVSSSSRKISQAAKSVSSGSDSRKSGSVRSASSDRKSASSKTGKSRSSSMLSDSKPSSDRTKLNSGSISKKQQAKTEK